MIISIDSGYSVTKSVMWDGKELRQYTFQSIAETCEPAQASQIDSCIKVNEVFYAMEDSARVINSSKVVGLETKTFHGSSLQYALLCWALEQLKIPDGNFEKLVISAPYSDSRDPELLKAISKFKKFNWIDSTGKEREINFKWVSLYPQGVGALRHFQAVTEISSEKITIFDYGSITLDVVSLRSFRGKPYTFNVGASGSVREGAGGQTLFEDWLRRVKNLPGLTDLALSYHDLSDKVETSNYTITGPGGVKRDVKVQYQESCRDFTIQTVRKCRQIVGNDWEDTEIFVLSGGISQCLDLSQWECRGRTYMTDSFANVLGQLHANVDQKDKDKVKEQISNLSKIKFLSQSGKVTEWKNK